MRYVFSFFVLLFLLAPAGYAQAPTRLVPLASYQTGVFDEGAAEIVAYDAASKRLVFTNAPARSIVILDIADPGAPVEVANIDLSAYGDRPTSVDAYDGLLAVAVPADPSQDPGQVVFLDTDGTVLHSVEVGALPDMLTFSPDGTTVLVANEGEPSGDYTNDPEGSVSIIDLSGGVTAAIVQTATFADFNAGGPRAAELPEGVRIFGPGASVAQDLEPEYVAVSADGAKAYVTLQENNAVAVIDVATAGVDAIVALGTKDHSLDENAFDASNEDGAINLQVWPVQGLYMPDAIATFTSGGETYLVTVNEGDARDYDAFSEEARVADLTLDPDAFADATTLQAETNLGRLNSTTASGDTDGDGDHDVIYSYGARSFTIWNAGGTLVYDSGSAFEEIIAEHFPDDFNATNTENDSFDNRSDDKGPEPEALAIGTIGDRTLAFIGLERIGGVMVYDVTDPEAPAFVSYTNNRDFSVDFDEDNVTPEILAAVGDLGPEGIAFIAAAESPNGVDLIAVSNEVSGSVTLFQVGDAPSEPAPLTLTLLHNNDGESQLINAGEGDLEDFGGVARFKTLADQLKAEALTGDSNRGVLLVSSGDNFLAGPEFNASLQLPEDEPLYDARALDLIGYDAFSLGNHDFDFGPDVTARFVDGFSNPVPFLAANVDFSGEPALQAFVDAGRIATRTILDVGSERVGIIGALTPMLPFISSPRNVVVSPEVARIVQEEIDALEAEGINKIILISHLQGIGEDQELIAQLRGLDIAVAGGGDELLANDDDLLVPGDGPETIFGPYPLLVPDAEGNDVPVVTTSGDYRYLGRLIVDFDEAGEITGISDESGPVRVAGGTHPDAVEPDPQVLEEVTEPVAEAVQQLAENVVATSEVPLNGLRDDVRSRETNLGNLIADALLWQATELAGAFDVPAPDIALQNGGGIRNNTILDPGPLTELTTFNVLPFGNFLVVVPEVEPALLKELLENAVSAVSDGGGRFAQVAGMRLIWDPERPARTVDVDGTTVLEPGSRVRRVELADGRVIVAGGAVVPGAPTVSLAIADFLARGGDQYPFGDTPFTVLGVSDQQVLANYLADGLARTVTAGAYPEGGESRIVEGDDSTSAGVSFTLVDAWTDADLMPLADGDTLNLSQLPHALTIRADAPEETESVRFWVNGEVFRTEGVAPYSLFGDVEGDYAAGRLAVDFGALPSTNTLAAAAYTEDRAEGDTVATASISLTVIASEGAAKALAADAAGALPDAYALEANYPNPFNPATTIGFSLPESAEVHLAVYDLLGRQVRVLVAGALPAGRHEVRFEMDDLPSGPYFYRLETAAQTFTRQMMLVK